MAEKRGKREQDQVASQNRRGRGQIWSQRSSRLKQIRIETGIGTYRAKEDDWHQSQGGMQGVIRAVEEIKQLAMISNHVTRKENGAS